MSFFERIYRDADAPYGEAADPFLVEHVGRGDGAFVLDAGGGTGRNALWLARNGYRVDLIDASPAGVRIAAEHAARESLPVEAKVADLRGWQPNRGYDLIVCAITLHAFKQHRAEAVAATLRDALLPGGRFFVSLHLAGGSEQHDREHAKQDEVEPRTYLANGHHKRLFTLEEARALLGWPAEVEAIATDESCPRKECPFLHQVYRAIARRPLS
jgi:SAM-dependent methyltransferase